MGYLSLIQLQAEIWIYFIWNNWICHQIDFHRITKDLKFRFCANFNIYIHWNWHSRHLYTLYTLSYKFTPLGFLTYWKVSKVGGVWPVRKIPEMTWSAFAYSLRVGRSWGELARSWRGSWGAVRGRWSDATGFSLGLHPEGEFKTMQFDTMMNTFGSNCILLQTTAYHDGQHPNLDAYYHCCQTLTSLT